MATKLPSPPRVGMVSLGCPKNLVDSERILTKLRAEGYQMSPDYAGADVVLGPLIDPASPLSERFELRDLSLAIYRRAAATAEAHGMILADTKFEFGIDDDGVLTLADEVLTSDSSRYWDAEAWATGTTPAERMASFDKQIVRDWLAAHWDGAGTPPELPAEIVERTADKYRELLERLTA